MLRERGKNKPFVLEDSLEYGWVAGETSQELPVSRTAFWVLGIIAAVVIGIIAGRVLFLGIGKGTVYSAQAEANVERSTPIAAPRGIITDRYGVVLADNKAAFSVLVDLHIFLKNKDAQNKTLLLLQNTLGLSPDDVYSQVQNYNKDGNTAPLTVYRGLTDGQAIALTSAADPALLIRQGYERDYPEGAAFATILGYTGLPTAADLKRDPELRSDSLLGKTALETQYNDMLSGTPGKTVEVYDARGKALQGENKVDPKGGTDMQLSVDAGLQKYFYNRLGQGLEQLGHKTGVGIIMDVKTGEVLSLVSYPSYDNNVFVDSSPTSSAARVALITDTQKPLYDRAVSGEYAPGSTIKPLVAAAALTENIVTPSWTIFSPGYLDIPNPYDPSKPTRYLDWRYQGTIDVHSAIAQSSDVYFYAVGGGIPGLQGLGITRLKQWWERFHLGQKTGIDLPGEQVGFLPDAAWKEKTTKRPWLLGDTYNVAIGQGDLSMTPIQLATYISTIANGGTVYKPYLAATPNKPTALTTINLASSVVADVQQGMRMTVTSPLGTAHTMNDLPMKVAAKTGSAQIENNTKENAFFVGYAPYDNPQIAIVLLVENAKEGSLNAVPIAKDILAWWYENRVKNPPPARP